MMWIWKEKWVLRCCICIERPNFCKKDIEVGKNLGLEAEKHGRIAQTDDCVYIGKVYFCEK